MKKVLIIILTCVVVCIGTLWGYSAHCQHKITASPQTLDFTVEKTDILERAGWLCEQVIVSPSALLKQMPAALGEHFAGEWAIYSCSYTVAALTNISRIYPEQKEECLDKIHQTITLALHPQLRHYDTRAWGDDAMETLDEDEGHMTYLSLVAWMMTNYRLCGGNHDFDGVLDSVVETLKRRTEISPYLSQPSYPGNIVYVPDMLVTIVALHQYYLLTGDKDYELTVQQWLDLADDVWQDAEMGLWVAAFNNDSKETYPPRGSYTALICYYLSLVDDGLAKEQYERMKSYLWKENRIFGCRIGGVKEYVDRSPLLGVDVDAGPIFWGYSPSGTAWAIGSATYFGDWESRYRMLLLAEMAGRTIQENSSRHYKLGEIALVGEAVALTMRTHRPS